MRYNGRKSTDISGFIRYHNKQFFDSKVDSPFDIGQKIKVRIKKIGKKGDGIGNIDGHTVIVSESKIGEEVSAIITSTSGNLIFAENEKKQD